MSQLNNFAEGRGGGRCFFFFQYPNYIQKKAPIIYMYVCRVLSVRICALEESRDQLKNQNAPHPPTANRKWKI